jgi:hypothetical protein
MNVFAGALPRALQYDAGVHRTECLSQHGDRMCIDICVQSRAVNNCTIQECMNQGSTKEMILLVAGLPALCSLRHRPRRQHSTAGRRSKTSRNKNDVIKGSGAIMGEPTIPGIMPAQCVSPVHEMLTPWAGHYGAERNYNYDNNGMHDRVPHARR